MVKKGAGIGTGNVGRHALTQLISPRCELTAVWVSSDAMADNRLPGALADYRRILAAGVKRRGQQRSISAVPVAGAARGHGQTDRGGHPDGVFDTICQWHRSRLRQRSLPLELAGTCQRIEQIQMRCMEIIDYDTYDSATVMFDVMGLGFGGASTRCGHSPGHIARAPAAALRFEVQGRKDGRVAVVLEHVTRLRDDLHPDWPQPAQEGGSYRIEITGEPSYALDLCLSSPNGDHNHAGLVATAARVVNAIPAVLAAPPGIRTMLESPLITGKGLYAER